MLVSSCVISGKVLAFVVVNVCDTRVKRVGCRRPVPLQVMTEVVFIDRCDFFPDL